jgi:glutamine---fructose-6-phosphate transaminase (isomerizing)
MGRDFEDHPVASGTAGGTLHTKMLSTIEEIRARGGNVVTVCTVGDDTVRPFADATLQPPVVSEYLMPCLLTIPLQLLACHVAVMRGRDVDRPRTLAKSVMVE